MAKRYLPEILFDLGFKRTAVYLDEILARCSEDGEHRSNQFHDSGRFTICGQCGTNEVPGFMFWHLMCKSLNREEQAIFTDPDTWLVAA